MAAALQRNPAAGLRALQFEPGDQRLRRTGELRERVKQAHEDMKACDLCANYCYVNRSALAPYRVPMKAGRTSQVSPASFFRLLPTIAFPRCRFKLMLASELPGTRSHTR